MSNKKNAVERITFIVLLVGGEKVVHTYDAPPTLKEAEKLIKDMGHRIGTSLTNKKGVLLWFSNPNICYNPDNVLGVQFGSITEGQMKKAVAEAKKTMGYVKPESSD